MNILRSSQNRRVLRLGAVAIVGILPLAEAHAGHRVWPGTIPPARYTAGLVDPDRTGSITPVPSPTLRSSVLGNAEAPEREPIAQRLGNTSGGGFR